MSRSRVNILLLWIVFYLLLWAIGYGLSACQDARHPTRDQARAAVVVTAEGVRVFGEICARYTLAEKDLDLARECARAYDAARLSLIGVSAGVDAWDRSQTTRESVTCAIIHALSEMEVAEDRLRRVGQFILVLTDARQLVSLLGGCREVRP